MDSVFDDFLVRKPRYQVGTANHLHLEVQWQVAGEQQCCPAELLDMSRDGVKLSTPRELPCHHAATLHMQGAGVKVEVPVQIRWVQPPVEGLWQSGCLFERQLDWETLGELFITGVLTPKEPGR